MKSTFNNYQQPGHFNNTPQSAFVHENPFSRNSSSLEPNNGNPFNSNNNPFKQPKDKPDTHFGGTGTSAGIMMTGINPFSSSSGSSGSHQSHPFPHSTAKKTANDTSGPPSAPKCRVCGQQFISFEELKRHIRIENHHDASLSKQSSVQNNKYFSARQGNTQITREETQSEIVQPNGIKAVNWTGNNRQLNAGAAPFHPTGGRDQTSDDKLDNQIKSQDKVDTNDTRDQRRPDAVAQSPTVASNRIDGLSGNAAKSLHTSNRAMNASDEESEVMLGDDGEDDLNVSGSSNSSMSGKEIEGNSLFVHSDDEDGGMNGSDHNIATTSTFQQRNQVTAKTEWNESVDNNNNNNNNSGTTQENPSSNMEQKLQALGTCRDKCPADERLKRVNEHDVHKLEQPLHLIELGILSANDIERMTGSSDSFDDEFSDDVLRHTMVKKFQRSSADHALQIPHLLRTPETLLRCIEYIEGTFMDVAFKTEINGILANGKALFVYLYIWDRYRMIAKDFTLQQSAKELLPLTSIWVECHERMARWFVLMDHKMQSDEDYIGGHAQQNGEQLNNLLKTLHGYYFRPPAHAVSPLATPNKAEFVCYFVLFQLGNGGEVSKYLQQLPSDMLQTEEIRFAVEVWGALKTDNYAKFSRLLKNKASLLQACLMHRYIGQVRMQALRKLVRGIVPPGGASSRVPLKDLMRIMLFESVTEAMEFVEHCGLEVVTFQNQHNSDDGSDILVVLQGGGASMVDSNLPRDKNGHAIMPVTRFMRKYIDVAKSKRPDGTQCPIAEICRGRLLRKSPAVNTVKEAETLKSTTHQNMLEKTSQKTAINTRPFSENKVVPVTATGKPVNKPSPAASATSLQEEAALRRKLLMSKPLGAGRAPKSVAPSLPTTVELDREMTTELIQDKTKAEKQTNLQKKLSKVQQDKNSLKNSSALKTSFLSQNLKRDAIETPDSIMKFGNGSKTIDGNSWRSNSKATTLPSNLISISSTQSVPPATAPDVPASRFAFATSHDKVTKQSLPPQGLSFGTTVPPFAPERLSQFDKKPREVSSKTFYFDKKQEEFKNIPNFSQNSRNKDTIHRWSTAPNDFPPKLVQAQIQTAKEEPQTPKPSVDPNLLKKFKHQCAQRMSRSAIRCWAAAAKKQAVNRLKQLTALYFLLWRHSYRRTIRLRKSFLENVRSVRIDSLVDDVKHLSLSNQSEAPFYNATIDMKLKRKRFSMSLTGNNKIGKKEKELSPVLLHSANTILRLGKNGRPTQGIANFDELNILVSLIGKTLFVVQSCALHKHLKFPVPQQLYYNLQRSLQIPSTESLYDLDSNINASVSSLLLHSYKKRNVHEIETHDSVNKPAVWRGELFFKLAIVSACSTAGVWDDQDCFIANTIRSSVSADHLMLMESSTFSRNQWHKRKLSLEKCARKMVKATACKEASCNWHPILQHRGIVNLKSGINGNESAINDKVTSLPVNLSIVDVCGENFRAKPTSHSSSRSTFCNPSYDKQSVSCNSEWEHVKHVDLSGTKGVLLIVPAEYSSVGNNNNSDDSNISSAAIDGRLTSALRNILPALNGIIPFVLIVPVYGISNGNKSMYNEFTIDELLPKDLPQGHDVSNEVKKLIQAAIHRVQAVLDRCLPDYPLKILDILVSAIAVQCPDMLSLTEEHDRLNRGSFPYLVPSSDLRKRYVHDVSNCTCRAVQLLAAYSEQMALINRIDIRQWIRKKYPSIDFATVNQNCVTESIVETPHPDISAMNTLSKIVNAVIRVFNEQVVDGCLSELAETELRNAQVPLSQVPAPEFYNDKATKTASNDLSSATRRFVIGALYSDENTTDTALEPLPSDWAAKYRVLELKELLKSLALPLWPDPIGYKDTDDVNLAWNEWHTQCAKFQKRLIEKVNAINMQDMNDVNTNSSPTVSEVFNFHANMEQVSSRILSMNARAIKIGEDSGDAEINCENICWEMTVRLFCSVMDSLIDTTTAVRISASTNKTHPPYDGYHFYVPKPREYESMHVSAVATNEHLARSSPYSNIHTTVSDSSRYSYNLIVGDDIPAQHDNYDGNNKRYSLTSQLQSNYSTPFLSHRGKEDSSSNEKAMIGSSSLNMSIPSELSPTSPDMSCSAKKRTRLDSTLLAQPFDTEAVLKSIRSETAATEQLNQRLLQAMQGPVRSSLEPSNKSMATDGARVNSSQTAMAFIDACRGEREAFENRSNTYRI